MSNETPEADEVTAPWWLATRERRLLLQECAGCGAVQHPPRAVCTTCGATDRLGWTVSGGAGAVDACTVVHRAPAPGFLPPYLVARVRLDEGPVLLSNVVTGDLGAVQIGDRVRVDWRPLPDGRALPVFTPSDEET